MTYVGLLALLSGIWGASFLFIKVGVAEIGPLTFAMLRVLIGSLVLLIIIGLRRERIPTDRASWSRYAFMGLFGILIPFGAIAWGTQYIASGLSAILNATTPLFTFVIAFLVGSEQVAFRRVVGLLVGFGGILVLTLPRLAGVAQSSLGGELAIVVASASYAVAVVYARRHLTNQSPLVSSLGQVSAGWALLMPFSLLERPWTFAPSTKALLALLALGIVGTGIAYIIYYRLIAGLGATGASLVTFVVPVFGVFWGWLLLRERLAWNAFVALAMVMVGMVLVNNLLSLWRANRPSRPGS